MYDNMRKIHKTLIIKKKVGEYVGLL